MRNKQDRNEKLVELRDKDPKTYSFSKLGEIFRIKKETAYEIYHREKARTNGKPNKYIARKYPALTR